MKRLLLSSFIALGLLSFNTPTNPGTHVQKPATAQQSNKMESADCRYGQCQAIAKSTGRQCQHCVSNAGDRYCWQHK